MAAMSKGLPALSETFTTAGGAANGSSRRIGATPCSRFAMQVVLDGVTAWTVLLQGSLDGSAWFTLVSHSNTSEADGQIVWASDKPVAFLRASVTAISGGTGIAVVTMGAG
jgi:hypothetical protein